jgi:hypothetical protein
MDDIPDNKYPSIARIFVRPLASPLPLGFFAFGVGTALLSGVELQWLPASEKAIVATVLLGYVAPLELLACIFGFLSRDTGTATAMGIFGSGWVTLAISFLLAGLTSRSTTIGMFMTLDALAVISLAIASISPKPLLGILLFLAAARFALAGAVQFGGPESLKEPTGILGLVTGGFAFYGGLALLLEDVKQRTVLPIFRRGPAKQSIEGTLADQLQHLQGEAGVRQQL